MSYCKKCGAYIPEGEQKCLACGYRDSSALGNFAVDSAKNSGAFEPSEKAGTRSSAFGERFVTRYSSRRREGGKGASRRYSSKRKAPQTTAWNKDRKDKE